jgi:hypothetical protein
MLTSRPYSVLGFHLEVLGGLVCEPRSLEFTPMSALNLMRSCSGMD